MTGILGGSFNPPHLAHLAMALLYLEANPGSEVWVIPCLAHPFHKAMRPFAERLAMCRLAFAGLGPRVKVLPLEARLGGVSYTARTLHHLQRRYPGRRFDLLIGSDILRQGARWKEFGWIRARVRLFVIPRGQARGGLFSLPAVSSSQIRRRLAHGQDVSRLLPLSVLSWIRRRRLYSSD